MKKDNIKLSKKPCILCNSYTVSTMRVSEEEIVPVCQVCRDELFSVESLKNIGETSWKE